MRYVAAYLLGSLSGKEPTTAEVEKILGSVGIEVDNDKLSKVFNELKGKSLEELMTSGREKLASMPVGGGAAVAAAPAAAGGAAAAPAAESKKEEKKKEESESEDEDMGFGLFD